MGRSPRVFCGVLALCLPGLVLAGLVSGHGHATASGPGPQASDEKKAAASFVLSGRVVEAGGGKPVVGAAVVISWTNTSGTLITPEGEIPPPVIDRTEAHTDATGGYSLTIPPERLADRDRWYAVIRVIHPDFITRKWDIGGLYRLLEGGKTSARLFPDTVTLERGVAYHAQVVRADGKPAAGVPYEFSNWISEGNAELEGRSDAEGRIRLRMPKAPGLAIRIPRGKDTAPFEHFWGVDHSPARPEDYAPPDLGVIRLGPGLTLAGRLLDLTGQPIAGHPLMLSSRYGGTPRYAVTEADGRFRFTLLRSGNYEIHGEGPDEHFPGGPAWQRSLDLNRVIRPVDVYLKEGVAAAPVELREAPTVSIQVRIVGARTEFPHGALPKSAVGGSARDPFAEFRERVNVYGFLPNAAGVDTPDPGPSSLALGGPSAMVAINEVPRETFYGVQWSVSGRADAEGHVALRALKGLRHVRLWIQSQGPPVAYKTQLRPGAPLRDTGGGWLGTLETDVRAITIHGYHPATVVATIRTEGGEPPPADAYARVDFLHESFVDGFDTSPYMEPEERIGLDHAFCEKVADGKFRCKYLIPDHEYAFFALATGYVPLRVEHRSLHEGSESELTLVMRKTPVPPAVGAPAPAFTVTLTDGRSLALRDLRGKFVLVHFWSPVYSESLTPIAPFRAVHDRFARDDRLVVLGFCKASYLEGAGRVIRAQRINWPQAVLRDGYNDPIVQDYPQTGALLIGPDGKVVARDLSDQKIEEAVARALAAK